MYSPLGHMFCRARRLFLCSTKRAQSPITGLLPKRVRFQATEWRLATKYDVVCMLICICECSYVYANAYMFWQACALGLRNKQQLSALPFARVEHPYRASARSEGLQRLAMCMNVYLCICPYAYVQISAYTRVCRLWHTDCAPPKQQQCCRFAMQVHVQVQQLALTARAVGRC